MSISETLANLDKIEGGWQSTLANLDRIDNLGPTDQEDGGFLETAGDTLKDIHGRILQSLGRIGAAGATAIEETFAEPLGLSEESQRRLDPAFSLLRKSPLNPISPLLGAVGAPESAQRIASGETAFEMAGIGVDLGFRLISAVIEGGIAGGTQLLKEVGVSDTEANKLARDAQAWVVGSMGVMSGGAIPRAPGIPPAKRVAARAQERVEPTINVPPRTVVTDPMKMPVEFDPRTTEVRLAPSPEPVKPALVVPPRPPQPSKPVWEMSLDEIKKAETLEKTVEKDDLVAVFGPEGAKRYRQLERRSGGATATGAEMDAVRKEMGKMEDRLTPEQEQRLFGYGETGPNAETLTDFRRALEDVNIESEAALGRSLGYAMSRIGKGSDPAKMKYSEQLAYAQLNHARRVMQEQGFDSARVSEAGLQAAAARFSDPSDAAFMLERFIRPTQGEPIAPRPTPALAPPAPAPVAPRPKPAEAVPGVTISEALGERGSARIGTFYDGDVAMPISLRADVSNPGKYSVVVKGEGGSQSFRMMYRGDRNLSEAMDSFIEYLTTDKALPYRVELDVKPKRVRMAEDIERAEIKKLKGRRYQTAATEKAIEIREARLKSDPAKWSVGDGIGYRVGTKQINRGFRITDINREAKTAVVEQVADTGITVTGGMDRLAPTQVHIADLVRDKKYDAAPAPRFERTPEGQQAVIPGAEKVALPVPARTAPPPRDPDSFIGGIFDTEARKQGDLVEMAQRPRKAPPQDIVQFLSQEGIRDTGGDLRNMDAHIAHKGKPFVRKLIREDGMTPDFAREAAEEAGYLPKGSTVADMYEAIDTTLRGDRAYAERDIGDVMARGERLADPAAPRPDIRTGELPPMAPEAEMALSQMAGGEAPINFREFFRDESGEGRSLWPVKRGQVEKSLTMRDALWDTLAEPFDFLTPLRRLPKQEQYLTERYLTLGRVDAIEKNARLVGKKFRAASKADRAAVYDFLTTKDASALTIGDASTRRTAVLTKKIIDKTGLRLVSEGLITKESFEAHRGEYLPRVYLKYLLPEGSGTGGGAKPSTLGYTKKRKDIPEEIRELVLGEIKDPAYLSAKAISQPASDLVILDFLDTISREKDWVYPETLVEWRGRKVSAYWLRAEADRIRNQIVPRLEVERQGAATEMAAQMETAARPSLDALAGGDVVDYKQIPDTPRYGKLRGMWVRKEIVDDIMGGADMVHREGSIAHKILGYGGVMTRANSLWKLSKVALNPGTQARNFVSNGILLHLSGVPFHRVPAMVTRAITEMTNNGPHWKVAQKYGVGKSTFANAELNRMRKEVLRIKHETMTPLAHIKRIGQAVGDAAGDVYGLSEAVFKTAKIIDGMERLKLPEGKAALEAHKALFDYSLVPPTVAYLRNSPIGIPFLTFYIKAFPRMVEAVIKRPTSFIPYLVVPTLLHAMIAAEYDVTMDDVDKLQKVLPKWLQDRGNAYILPYKDKHGRWQAMDMGYFFPWSMYTEFVKHVKDGNVRDAIQTMGATSSPMAQIISAVTTNIDPFTEREIVNPADPPAKQVADLMKYTWDLAVPSWVGSRGAAVRMYDAIQGKGNYYGDPGYTLWQAAGRFAGVNTYPIEPAASRQRNIGRMLWEIDDIDARRSSALRDKRLSKEERDTVRKTYQELMNKRRDELRLYRQESKLPRALR